MSNDEDLLVSSEVVNADWQFDVVRTYVLGVEILDTRLSDAEFRLLALLRLRAGGGRNNHVSYEKLAEDLGTTPRTVGRTMAGLKKSGYVTCESRGYGNSSKKTIASMSDRFAADILTMNRKQLLGTERNEELLNRLRGLDSAAEHPLRTDLSSSETIEESGVHSGQKCPPIQDKNVLSDRTNLSSKVNQDNVNHFQVDGVRSAHTSGSEDGDPRGDQTTVVSRSQNSSGETPRDEADDRLDLARRVGEGALQNASDRSRVQSVKRADRREQRDRDGTTEANRAAREAAKQERVTARSFYEWMCEKLGDRFQDVPENMKEDVTAKELAQIKHMLDAYRDDLDLIRELWENVCDNWDEVSSTLKIKGSFPTVAMFMGYRKQLMSIFPSKKKDDAGPKVGSKIGKW